MNEYETSKKLGLIDGHWWCVTGTNCVYQHSSFMSNVHKISLPNDQKAEHLHRSPHTLTYEIKCQMHGSMNWNGKWTMNNIEWRGKNPLAWLAYEWVSECNEWRRLYDRFGRWVLSSFDCKAIACQNIVRYDIFHLTCASLSCTFFLTLAFSPLSAV